MRLVICDDEKNIQLSLSNRIRKHFPKIKIDAFSSAEDLLASASPVSIYLLDIEMPGISGMELAREIRTSQNYDEIPNPIIIFITGYPDHMPDAFDVRAYHYLLKPIDETKFLDVMTRAITDAETQLAQIEDTILIESGSNKYKIPTEELIYLESANKKILFHLLNRNLELYGKIGKMEGLLPPSFFRCHRCYMVNLSHVVTYNRNLITVSNGETIPLSKSKYNLFVQSFIHYAKNGGIVRV